jgi:hypothetical protein
MIRGTMKLKIPNVHEGDIGPGLLSRILRQAGISREEWTISKEKGIGQDGHGLQQSDRFTGKVVKLTFALSGVPAGDTPCVYWYDGSIWHNLGGTVSGDTISVNVDHFSEFAAGVVTNNYGVESFPILNAKPSFFEKL